MRMTDHHQKTLESLDEIAQLRADLADAYEERNRNARVAIGQQNPAIANAKVADLHHRLGVTLKVGAIHSHLAIAQALQDREAPL